MQGPDGQPSSSEKGLLCKGQHLDREGSPSGSYITFPIKTDADSTHELRTLAVEGSIAPNPKEYRTRATFPPAGNRRTTD